MSRSIRPAFWILVSAFSLSSCGAGQGPRAPESGVTGGSGQNYAVRRGNAEWVKACVAKLPKQKVKVVDGTMHELCRKPDFYYSAPNRYVLSRKGDELELAYKIRFDYFPADTSDADARVLFEMAKSCAPKIDAFWSRYGVRVKLEMESSRERVPFTPRLAPLDVYLVNYRCRSNTSYFCKDEPEQFCKTMAHEVAHHFGLEDEYYDGNCPDRPLVSQERDPYSLMAEIFQPWDALDLFERHMRSVFAEFCGDPAPPKTLPPRGWVNLGPPH